MRPGQALSLQRPSAKQALDSRGCSIQRSRQGQNLGSPASGTQEGRSRRTGAWRREEWTSSCRGRVLTELAGETEAEGGSMAGVRGQTCSWTAGKPQEGFSQAERAAWPRRQLQCGQERSHRNHSLRPVTACRRAQGCPCLTPDPRLPPGDSAGASEGLEMDSHLGSAGDRWRSELEAHGGGTPAEDAGPRGTDSPCPWCLQEEPPCKSLLQPGGQMSDFRPLRVGETRPALFVCLFS